MAGLAVRRFDDAEAFQSRAGGFLAAREAEHNLIFAILRFARDRRGVRPYLALVEDGPDVVACAVRTPPRQLVLSELDQPGAVKALVQDHLDVDPGLTGVLGPKEATADFVRHWTAATGAAAHLHMEQRIHRAEKARRPGDVRGRFREASARDRELLVRWWLSFAEEVGEPVQRGDAEAEVDGRSAGHRDRGLVLWEADGPVSMAGFSGPTPNGIRVGPVYTPPDERGRGYATACVAELTRRLLEHHRFCFLFTDLANPTSNAIYRRIGYEPVRDVDAYRFAPPRAG